MASTAACASAAQIARTYDLTKMTVGQRSTFCQGVKDQAGIGLYVLANTAPEFNAYVLAGASTAALAALDLSYANLSAIATV